MSKLLKTLNIIDKILFYSFFIIGAFSLIFRVGTSLFYITLILSFIASWVFAYIYDLKKINPKYKILINISLWLNIIGQFEAYTKIFAYDKILHLIVPAFITILIYEYYSNSLKLKKDMIFFTVLGMLVIWEIFEYAGSSVFGLDLVGVLSPADKFVLTPYDDTMLDLITGMMSSILVLFFKKEKSYKTLRGLYKKYKS